MTSGRARYSWHSRAEGGWSSPVVTSQAHLLCSSAALPTLWSNTFLTGAFSAWSAHKLSLWVRGGARGTAAPGLVVGCVEGRQGRREEGYRLEVPVAKTGAGSGVRLLQGPGRH